MLSTGAILKRLKLKKGEMNDMTNKTPYQQVREFHKAFNHPYNDTPMPIDGETAVSRSIWTGEELVEFLYATAGGDNAYFETYFTSLIKGLEKAKRKTIEKQPDVSNKVVAQADALTDVSYFNYGTFVVLGVEPNPLFNIVHNANMGKLHPDGKPRYREEDGKIMKPENWERDFAPEPKLKKEIKRQKDNAEQS